MRAEAGSWSEEGQKNVAKVILNRVNSDKFPNTIKEVVFQKGQFQVISNGMYKTVEISNFLVDNVVQVYLEYYDGKTDKNGALFFTLGTFKREYLYTDEVGHNFYK